MERNIGNLVPFKEPLIFIDCETTNLTDKDIFQIGAIVCENGVITNIIDEYVKPFGEFDEKSKKNNDITYSTVKNSPTFEKLWEEKFSFINGSYIFVAHNAKFDLEAITKSLLCYGKKIDRIKYIDTERVARYSIPQLPKTEFGWYTRENICKYLNIDIKKNHDALSDVFDCLNMLCLFVESYAIKLNRFISEYSFTKPTNHIKSKDYNLIYANKSHLTREEIAMTVVNDECDKDFVGKTVVLTGDFALFPERKRAEIEIRRRGGKTVSDISSTTNFLIVGENLDGKNLSEQKSK